MLIGNKGWRIRSAKHFAERHGLIVIVALGESIVAIGVGMSGTAVSWPVLAASLLGLSISASIWWAYFKRVSLAGEHHLAELGGRQRTRMAQFAYSYLHLPMVAGIVLAALGMKKVLEYVSDPTRHSLTDGLCLVPRQRFWEGPHSSWWRMQPLRGPPTPSLGPSAWSSRGAWW